MSLMKDAYHVRTGLTRMYAVDAQNAVSMHPEEWSLTPWSQEEAEAASKAIEERHAREVEDAKAKGLPAPAPLPEVLPPTPEEQEAIDEYNRLVAEARGRLDARREKLAAEKAEAEQIAADEALVKSPPPRPDPTARRRPFNRPGEPTPAEVAMMDKRDAEKAEREREAQAERDRIAKEKSDVDKVSGAKVTG